MKKREINKYCIISIAVGIIVFLLLSNISSINAIEESSISYEKVQLTSLGNYQSDELIIRINHVDNAASSFEYDTVNIQVLLDTESGEIGVQSEVTFPEAYGIFGNKVKTKSTDGDGRVSFIAGGVDGNNDELVFDITARKTTETGEVIDGSHNGFILENRQLQVVLTSEVNERDQPIVKVLDHNNQRVKADLHFNNEIISVSKIGETRINIIPDLLEGEEDYTGCGYVSFNNIYASKKYYKDSEPVTLKVNNLNFPPYIPIEIDVPDESIVGYEQIYSFSSKDGDGNNVDYYIDWDDGSIKDWDGPYQSEETVSYKHTYMQIGTYTIKVKTKDIHGEVSIINEISTVISNNAPDKPVFNYDNSELKDGETGIVGKPYCFTISTSDIDGDVHRLEYGWDWNNDGIVDIWDNNNGEYYKINEVASIEKSFNNNVYYISVRARDCFGVVSSWSDSIQIIVGNQIPDKPNSPTEYEDREKDGECYIITFKGMTYDINGDKLSYKFRFVGNGEDDVTDWLTTQNGGFEPGQPVLQSHKYYSVGKYYVYIKASDLDENGNIKSESEWSEPYVLRIWMPPKSDNDAYTIDADACLPMKIDLLPNDTPTVTYDMIPKNLAEPETTIRAFVDRTYGIYNKGLLVEDNLQTSTEVVDFLINGPSTPDQENADSDQDDNVQEPIEDDPDETDIPLNTLTAYIDCDNSGSVGESICFQGSATGGSDQNTYSLVFGSSTEETTYSYHWDFDDGTTKSGQIVFHSFSSPGTYTVELTVTDANGQSDNAYEDVIISDDSNSNPMMYNLIHISDDFSDTIQNELDDINPEDIIKPIDVDIQFDGTGSTWITEEVNTVDDSKEEDGSDPAVEEELNEENQELSNDGETKEEDIKSEEDTTFNEDISSEEDKKEPILDDDTTSIIGLEDDTEETLKDQIIKFLVKKLVEKIPFIENIPFFKQYLDEEETTTISSSSMSVQNSEITVDEEPYELNDNNDLVSDMQSVTPIWVFGDGEYTVGWKPTHTYHIDPIDYIDVIADETIIDETIDLYEEPNEVIKTSTFLDPILPPEEDKITEPISDSDDSEDISNDDSSLLESLSVSYDVMLLLIKDPDNLITNENIDEIDIQDFTILGIDTTIVEFDISMQLTSSIDETEENIPLTDENEISDELVDSGEEIFPQEISLSIF